MQHCNIYFQGPGTIQILSDALPKIVPYVLINHREVIYNYLLKFCILNFDIHLHYNEHYLPTGASPPYDVCN